MKEFINQESQKVGLKCHTAKNNAQPTPAGSTNHGSHHTCCCLVLQNLHPTALKDGFFYSHIFPKWILLSFCFLMLPMSELMCHVIESNWQSLSHMPAPWMKIEFRKVGFWLQLELEVHGMHRPQFSQTERFWKSAKL